MLQQTRVETVRPYFNRFIERFPTVDSLAAAAQDEVLALWSGLGYYRRARQLHAAARQIVADGGRMPSSEEELQKLPGVGPYTAAAVASIAFGVVAPVLDGNVERVLSRVLALEGDPRRAATRRRLLEAAGRLLDPARPGDSNQALMELGATVCTPKSPECGECPLAAGCAGLATGSPEHYPQLPERRKPRRQHRVAVVVERDARVLLIRRPDDSELLAGTWEFPWAPAGKDGGIEQSLAERFGGNWQIDRRLGRVRHAITHRALEVEVVRGSVAGGEAIAQGIESGWFTAEEIERLASSSLVGKILRCAGAAGTSTAADSGSRPCGP